MREVSVSTGEDSTKSVAHYHHCKITIHDCGTVLFSGSIHKMYNSISGIFAPNYEDFREYKGFNGNQFCYHGLDLARQHLKTLFGVPSENMIIQNIEYGVNLVTSFDPMYFIKGLLPFEMKPFEYKYSEHLAQSVHRQYILKVYNKGNQYNMPFHTLRFEMKVTKMEHQKKDVGITSMADFKTSILTKAFKYLNKHLKKVLYYDRTIKESSLTQKQKIKLKEYYNPRYWSNLTPKERLRNKIRLNQIIELHSQNLKQELLETLKQNWVEFDRLSVNHLGVEFDSSNIVSDSTLLPQRKCPITGLDISMQKPESKLLSNTGLKHYEKFYPETFKKLRQNLLTGQPNKFERSIYDMISKQIRNTFYNNPARFNPCQGNLFGLFFTSFN